ncbi:MAG: caspase family protein [Chitinophagaceae bacterium]|nr:caspase family protein [Chitinophagaceae bacterium]
MRLVLLLCFAAVFTVPAFAQQSRNNTYAIVIGIAGYENKNLKPLVYSNKDAQLFAQWLQSAAGGDVPASNIRVLLNEQATVAAIYNALDWVKQQCKEGDEVYFYFSGHGDLETADKQNKGYLLAYNTPPHNYPNNAVAVEQLNADANFLTLQKKVKVVLITDACHSGKLAGDFFKGRQWVAQQLQQVLNNEIRLAACAADEEAAEGEFWGGGRGVFSYYLLKGLYGRADVLKDGQITFEELQQYIDASFKTDEYLQLLKHKQSPVTDGNPLFVLTKVDTATSQLFQQQQQQKDTIVLQPVDAFFKHAANYPLESFIDFDSLPGLNEKSFSPYIIDLCSKQDSLDNSYEENGITKFYSSGYGDTLQLLKKQLLTDISLRKQFIELFTELVHNSAQSMINAYLNGEESELEKRQYYYSGARNYNDFLPVIKTALQFIPPNHHLAGVLQINLHYLSGVLARLNMAVSKKTDSLLKTAFNQLYKTLELEPYAAYVHNEIANLYVHQKNFDSAQYHFDFAAALAPAWAIPWSNQIRMNMMLKNNIKAKQALHKADSLQPNLSYVYMNAGLLMEREKNVPEAMSYFLRAAKLNPVHYLPFERLGYLYLQTGDYQKAETCFSKAASLKNDFAINADYFRYGVELGGFPRMDAGSVIDSCFKKAAASEQNTKPLWLLLRTITAQKNSPADSIFNTLRLIIQQQPAIILAHHFLGKKLVEQGRYSEAVPFLKEAPLRYTTDTLLRKEIISITGNQQLFECLVELMPLFIYNPLEDYYLLARAYEQQQLFSEAIAVYEQAAIIENNKLKDQAAFKDFDKHFTVGKNKKGEEIHQPVPMEEMLLLYETPVKTSAAVQLMKLYERMQNYEKAEAALLHQIQLSRSAGDLRRKVSRQVPGTDLVTGISINFFWINANRELEITIHDFYTGMMQLQLRNYYWKQQAALFLYQRLQLAYIQLPQEQYAAFTNDFERYAYPWNTSDEIYKAQTAQWPLPGLNDTIVIQTPAFLPVQTALTYAQQAEVLSPNETTGAETAIMFVDLYNWMDKDAEATNWYEYALSLQPKDAVTRNKFVQLLLYTGYHTKAKLHLDTLESNGQIDSSGVQQLIFFYTIAGNYKKAAALINQSAAVSIKDNCRNTLQRANVLLQQKQYSNVINLLDKKFPAVKLTGMQYEDSVEVKQMLGIRYYMMARCYAILKQDAAAVMNLNKAFANDFTCYRAVLNDTAWSVIKKGSNKKIFQQVAKKAADDVKNPQEISINPINIRIPDESKNIQW